MKRSAFTLVELLVVVSIIALLVSILLPSLETARSQSQTATCRARLHDINTAVVLYGMQFKDWLPGAPGTSGLELQELEGMVPGGDLAEDTPGVSVQNWDWQAPLALYSLNYNDLVHVRQRSKRWALVRNLEIYQCPSNNFLAVPYAGALGAGPWSNQPQWGILTMNSFSTIRDFMFFGTIEGLDDGIHQPGVSHWSRKTPEGHAPRLSSIQRASDKAFMVDGARYVTSTGIDFDVGYHAIMGGSFSCAGPSSGYSNAFVNPVELGPFDDARKDRYMYRHASGGDPGLNTLFFDGHVAGLTKREAITAVDYWYPSGTLVKAGEFQGQNPKPEALQVIEQRPADANEPGFFPIY